MNSKIPRILYLFIILVFILSYCNKNKFNDGLYGEQKKEATVNRFQCIKQQSQCFFDIANGRSEVLFNVDKITAEQVFSLSVNYLGNNTITSVNGYLEGVDMYMGKIPLLLEFIKPEEKNQPQTFKAEMKNEIYNDIEATEQERIKPLQAFQDQQVFQGQLQLGSCSAETMTWRMWLTFTTSDNKKYNKTLTITSNRTL